MKSVEPKGIRKGSAAGYDEDAYESTPFGRRRISKVPKPIGRMLALLALLGIPGQFLRRFQRTKAG